MKPITKQLIIGMFIMVLITMASLGIRHIQFSDNRAGTVESRVIAETEYDHLLAELEAIDTEHNPQYAGVSELDEKVPEDYSEAKPSKGDYVKGKKSKGLQKISISDNENLYITGNGETWYVSEGPDGKTTKMQVHIDKNTGQMNVINISDGRSGGLKRISMSNNEDLYITGEGDLWYVSEGPDGSTTKNQALVDETTGEMILIDPDDGEK